MADALDAGAVREAVVRARPEAVVNQLTELPSSYDARSLRRAAGPTTRLRTEGNAILLEAARAAGARRYVVQSIAVYAAPGPGLAGEEEPLATDAPGAAGAAVRTIAELERTALAATDLEPVVLRYGYFYGPGTWYAPDGSVADQLRRRRMPIVGSGGAVYSFVHVDDAAEATVRALAGAAPGVHHVVDDEPIALRDLLGAYARTLGAPAPRRVPRIAARMVAGRRGLPPRAPARRLQREGQARAGLAAAPARARQRGSRGAMMR